MVDAPGPQRAELSDEQVDRMLAGGAPAGPELDGLWQRVRADLEPELGSASSSWWKRWLRPAWLRPVVATGAVACLALIAVSLGDRAGGDPSGLRARGGAQSGAVLEATCGTESAPCRVGEPVFLRVHGGEGATVAVALVADGQPELLYGPWPVAAGETLAVPKKVTPQRTDVEAGIDLALFARPGDSAGERPDSASLLAGDPIAELHLEVRR